MRGVIQHIRRSQQINDFSGLLFGSITPTDMDGVIEYKNKAYVFFEIKYLDKDLPYGQRLFLERLVRDVCEKGKKAIAAVIEHSMHDVNESVPAAQCKVREIYFFKDRIWRPPKKAYTAFELVQDFFKYADKQAA